MARRCAGFLICLAAIAQAQMDDMPKGRVFVASPPETLLTGIGTSDFPVTTKDELARKLTRQGFALMHCFWFNEAVRSFRDAVKRDPSCAIALCGLHIALTLPWNQSGDDKEAKFAIEHAALRQAPATKEEQAMIEAFRLRSLAKDKAIDKWRDAMRSAADRFPKQSEFVLLWAAIDVQSNFGDYDGSGHPANRFAELLPRLLDVVKREPDNAGAHHYLIHIYEAKDPASGVRYADRLGLLAPLSSHMVHMPGHIYYRVGDYFTADKVFQQARKADIDMAEKLGVTGANPNWNFFHNNNFIAINLVEMGRFSEAKKLLGNGNFQSSWVRWRTADWAAAGGNAVERFDKGEKLGAQAAYFAGMLLLERGRISEARRCLALLIGDIKSTAPESVTDRIDVTSRWDLECNVLAAEGNMAAATEAFAKAVKAHDEVPYEEPPYYGRPPQETFGWTLLRLKRPSEAVAAFEAGLKVRPNSGWVLYGLASAHELAGHGVEAKAAYQKFLAAWAKADADHPYMVHARAVVGG